MNILIFGTPRSGTTSLFFAIKEQLLFGYSEPFNTESGDYYLEKKDIQQTINDNPNFCFKTLVHQMPKSFRKDGYNMLSIIEHFNHLSTMFDKIIFLDRRNYNEHWESYCNLIHKINVRKEAGSIETYGFKQWYSDEITYEIKEGVEKGGWKDLLNVQKETLKILSDNYNIPITYYEDLYSTDTDVKTKVLNNLDLGLDNELILKHLHPKHKLRQEGSKPLL